MPKGPSLDPDKKLLAVHVEDHPLEYGSFEGVIPQGEYGGGTVMLWDRGTWEPEGDAAESYRRGKLVFRLHGERLKGLWALIRMGGKAGQDGKNWLLKKLDDEEARSGEDDDILSRITTSVATGRTMEQIADNRKPAKNSTSKMRRPKKPATSERPDLRIQRSSTANSVDPAQLAGARRTAMPATIAPELPALVKKVPQGTGWLHELKLDGYRMIGFVRDARRRSSRGEGTTGPIVSRRSPLLFASSPDKSAIVDGEVVMLNPDGTSDFQALQNVMRRGNDTSIVYYLFDLLYFHGYDLRQVPLTERKRLLSQLIGQLSTCRRFVLATTFPEKVRRSSRVPVIMAWKGLLPSGPTAIMSSGGPPIG